MICACSKRKYLIYFQNASVVMGYCGDDGTGHVALHRSLGMEALSAV